MQIQPVKREQAKLRLALQGPSGSGKTWGALQVAFGITGDWSKVVVVDTENHSASLYAHLGPYNSLTLTSPFDPEKFIQAIDTCEKAGMGVIILDSISHLWEGSGGILDIHGSMAGNSFTNWNKVTPRFNAFVQRMLQSSSHVIATMRCKQDYVLVDKNGRQVPEKVGLKAVQRDGLDYEFSIVLDLDIKHFATASKDRTALFAVKPPFKLTTEVGEVLRQWCLQGAAGMQTMVERIQTAGTVGELLQLFRENPDYQTSLLNYFTERRKQLEPSQPMKVLAQAPLHLNGTH